MLAVVTFHYGHKVWTTLKVALAKNLFDFTTRNCVMQTN